jgi:hypothetical protein
MGPAREEMPPAQNGRLTFRRYRCFHCADRKAGDVMIDNKQKKVNHRTVRARPLLYFVLLIECSYEDSR